MSNPTGEAPVVLFDGVCNLCNGAVGFILRNEAQTGFQFASLQSDEGRRLLQEHGLPEDALDTIILVEDGRAYARSTAALRIARRLRAPWKWLYAFLILPAPLRDLVYRFIAKNRYRWFGQSESCMIPTPELRARFLS